MAKDDVRDAGAAPKAAPAETPPLPLPAGIISVSSALPAKPDGGNPVALWEVDPAHPGGEAYVAGPTVVKVAKTTAVKRAIADGTIVEV